MAFLTFFGVFVLRFSRASAFTAFLFAFRSSRTSSLVRPFRARRCDVFRLPSPAPSPSLAESLAEPLPESLAESLDRVGAAAAEG